MNKFNLTFQKPHNLRRLSAGSVNFPFATAALLVAIKALYKPTLMCIWHISFQIGVIIDISSSTAATSCDLLNKPYLRAYVHGVFYQGVQQREQNASVIIALQIR